MPDARTPQKPANGQPKGSGGLPAPMPPQPDPLTAQVRQEIDDAMAYGAKMALAADHPDEYKAWAAGVLSMAQALAGGQRPVGGKP